MGHMRKSWFSITYDSYSKVPLHRNPERNPRRRCKKEHRPFRSWRKPKCKWVRLCHTACRLSLSLLYLLNQTPFRLRVDSSKSCYSSFRENLNYIYCESRLERQFSRHVKNILQISENAINRNYWKRNLFDSSSVCIRFLTAWRELLSECIACILLKMNEKLAGGTLWKFFLTVELVKIMYIYLNVRHFATDILVFNKNLNSSKYRCNASKPYL